MTTAVCFNCLRLSTNRSAPGLSTGPCAAAACAFAVDDFVVIAPHRRRWHRRQCSAIELPRIGGANALGRAISVTDRQTGASDSQIRLPSTKIVLTNEPPRSTYPGDVMKAGSSEIAWCDPDDESVRPDDRRAEPLKIRWFSEWPGAAPRRRWRGVGALPKCCDMTSLMSRSGILITFSILMVPPVVSASCVRPLPWRGVQADSVMN